MPLLDDKGNPIDIPVAGSFSEAGSNLSTLPRALASTIPPALLSGGAGYAAGKIAEGADLGPLAAIPVAMAAAGTANVVGAKALPKSLGGMPDASIFSDFAWGALPEGIGRGVAAGTEAAVTRRLVNAGRSFMKMGREDILDPENLAVQNRLLTPPERPPFQGLAQSGTDRTARANAARQPILDVVHQMRKRYGEPIGKAYDLVGEVKEPVDTGGYAGFVDNIRDQERGVTSGTSEKYLNQLRNMDPEVQRAKWEAEQAELKKTAPAAEPAKVPQVLNETAQNLGFKDYQDAVTRQPQLAETMRQLAGVEMTATGTVPEPEAEFKPRKVSFDELRRMRQQVNLDLQKAQHGDRYVLGRIQDRLDDKLMDYLPDNMGEMRAKYRGMIHRWDYQWERRMNGFSDPKEVVNDVFSNPEDAKELMTEAKSPQQRDDLRSRFIQYAWGDPPAGATRKVRADAVRARLAPYVEHPETTKMLLGDQAGTVMNQAVAWAQYAPDLAQDLSKNPKKMAAFQRIFNQYFVNAGKDPNQATAMALQRLLRQMPGAEEMTPQGPVIPTVGKQMPAIPEIAGSTPMIPKAAHGNSFSNANVVRHGTMAGLHLATGNVGWGAVQAAEALPWIVGSKGFTAASKLGVTRIMLNAFKAKTPTEAAWWLAHSLDVLSREGAQIVRQAEPVEQDNAP